MRLSLSPNGPHKSTRPDIPCTAESIELAKREQMRARAEIVQDLPATQRPVLVSAFVADDPDVSKRVAWQDVQRQEHYQAEEIALAAIRIRYGTSAGLTPRQCSDLECGATYLIRRHQPVFVQTAREHAANALLSCAEFQVATIGKSKVEQMVMALRIVSGVWTSFHAVMEARIPLMPKLYLDAQQTNHSESSDPRRI